MPKRKPSVQHDELESPAAMEKRLGIAAETRKAAKKYAATEGRSSPQWYYGAFAVLDFLAGVRWERRRRARRGG